jgi:hypothetical protein
MHSSVSNARGTFRASVASPWNPQRSLTEANKVNEERRLRLLGTLTRTVSDPFADLLTQTARSSLPSFPFVKSNCRF